MESRETFPVLYAIKKIDLPFGQDAFADIVTYIQSCDAYHDRDTKVFITPSAIYFGHALREIEAAFPKLKLLLMTDNSKAFSETNLSFRSYYNQMGTKTALISYRPIAKAQQELAVTAQAYFKVMTKQKPEPISSELSQYRAPNKILTMLMAANNGLALGEQHEDFSPKKLLIDNMEALKESGVTTIFLEHLLEDTQRDLLKKYLSGPSDAKMPIMLREYLNFLDNGFRLKNHPDQIISGEFQPYGFIGLVLQAKKYGMNIVPIDTSISYATGSQINKLSELDADNRCLMMNYVAAQQIKKFKQQHPNDKFIVFCGSKHINAFNSSIPGMAEITGAPTLVVEDVSDRSSLSNRERISLSSTHPAKPDVLIVMRPIVDKEAQALQKDYTRQSIKPDMAIIPDWQPDIPPEPQKTNELTVDESTKRRTYSDSDSDSDTEYANVDEFHSEIDDEIQSYSGSDVESDHEDEENQTENPARFFYATDRHSASTKELDSKKDKPDKDAPVPGKRG